MTSEMEEIEAVPDYLGALRLDGRTMVVVGAGQGMGRQSAHALSACGAHVLCVDVDADRAKAVASEVGGSSLVVDACEREGVQEIVATAQGLEGTLSGFVDVVGVARYMSLLDTTDEDWDWTFRLNFRHAALLASLGGAALAENGGGTLVYIASVSGLAGAQNHAAYGAAKAALMSMVRSAAVELGPLGVRVNAVAPGTVWTPRISVTIGPEAKAHWERNVPLQHVALPKDIAGPVTFLSTGWSRFVNGQVLVADGGVSQKFPYPIDTL